MRLTLSKKKKKHGDQNIDLGKQFHTLTPTKRSHEKGHLLPPKKPIFPNSNPRQWRAHQGLTCEQDHHILPKFFFHKKWKEM